MREAAVARSLSKSLALTHPVVFLLLAPSVASDLSIHSFDHRAFLLVDSRLVPTSLTIVNVGPRYRGQYQCHTFAPESPMPWLPPPPANIGEQSTEEEEMYSGMLRRLERLAQEAEEGNKRLLRQVLVHSMLCLMCFCKIHLFGSVEICIALVVHRLLDSHETTFCMASNIVHIFESESKEFSHFSWQTGYNLGLIVKT
uniref:Uncharacterized protein n=1 Tax=Aegilops tauschii TaxID=37682 RepID=M8AT90_AEGTA